ncbi:MAG: hypothetical protein KF777_21955, partial [Planctomycetaceae bacterium]|nr:hypothetical protein [Planctomycetaceae bacterium]
RRLKPIQFLRGTDASFGDVGTDLDSIRSPQNFNSPREQNLVAVRIAVAGRGNRRQTTVFGSSLS